MERMPCYKLIERFNEPTLKSWVTDRMNHSLFATTNETPFCHYFNPTLSWAECSRNSHKVCKTYVYNVNLYSIKGTENLGSGSALSCRFVHKELWIMRRTYHYIIMESVVYESVKFPWFRPRVPGDTAQSTCVVSYCEGKASADNVKYGFTVHFAILNES